MVDTAHDRTHRWRLDWTHPRAARGGWMVWGILFLIVSGLVLSGSKRSVTSYYREGTNRWLQGVGLYDGSGTGFIYLPQAAMLFVPFHAFPHHLGEILWRCSAIGLFALGVWKLSQLASSDKKTELFAVMSIICVPLCWSCARNGQSTLPMAGPMLVAVAFMARGHWWRAAGFLALAMAIKPMAIVLVLLAAALHPPMRSRLAVGLLAVFAFPFVWGAPEYVWSQYGEFLEMLRVGREGYWAHALGVLKVVGIETAPITERTIQCVTALATLALCGWLMRRHSAEQGHILLYALAVTYLLLFGPRTENNTYALLGPALAAIASQAIWIERRPTAGWYYLLCGLTVVGSYEFGRLVVPPERAVWLAPVGCFAFALGMVRHAARQTGKWTSSRGGETAPRELSAA